MEPSHSAESREYLTPYSVQQHRDGRYSTEPSPTSQQYLQHHGPHSHLSPELGRPSNMSSTSSPHYSNNVGTSIQSYSHLEAQNHGHVSYPHSAPGTPLPHTPLPLPSSHSSGYLDAFSDVPMHSVMGMEMDPTLGIDLRVLSSERHRDYRILEERQRPRPNTLAPEATGSGRTQRATSAESADSAKREQHGGTARSGGGKKARGRPRLDTTDENAADVSTSRAIMSSSG